MGNKQCCCRETTKEAEFVVPKSQSKTKAPTSSIVRSKLATPPEEELGKGEPISDPAFQTSIAPVEEHAEPNPEQGMKQSSLLRPDEQLLLITHQRLLESKFSAPEQKANSSSEIRGTPRLNEKVKETLSKTKFFIVEDLKQYPLQWEKKLEGFARYLKSDGSLYMGYFQNGLAHGRGVFIFSDGSYYEGMFRHDQADSYGVYNSKDLVYKGNFLENQFNGKGVEKGDNYQYDGTFEMGARLKGTLVWTENQDEFTFKGTFNSYSQFEGFGVLREPTGVYSGNFSKGIKQGQGTYAFKNGFTYTGNYQNNKREGFGQVKNSKRELVYKGQFEDNLPTLQNAD